MSLDLCVPCTPDDSPLDVRARLEQLSRLGYVGACLVSLQHVLSKSLALYQPSSDPEDAGLGAGHGRGGARRTVDLEPAWAVEHRRPGCRVVRRACPAALPRLSAPDGRGLGPHLGAGCPGVLTMRP